LGQSLNLFEAPHLIYGLVGMTDDVKRGVDNPRVRQTSANGRFEGRPHVNAHRSDAGALLLGQGIPE
jgi:hypothetical protein